MTNRAKGKIPLNARVPNKIILKGKYHVPNFDTLTELVTEQVHKIQTETWLTAVYKLSAYWQME